MSNQIVKISLVCSIARCSQALLSLLLLKQIILFTCCHLSHFSFPEVIVTFLHFYILFFFFFSLYLDLLTYCFYFSISSAITIQDFLLLSYSLVPYISCNSFFELLNYFPSPLTSYKINFFPLFPTRSYLCIKNFADTQEQDILWWRYFSSAYETDVYHRTHLKVIIRLEHVAGNN